jgi:hypothetical protein
MFYLPCSYQFSSGPGVSASELDRIRPAVSESLIKWVFLQWCCSLVSLKSVFFHHSLERSDENSPWSSVSNLLQRSHAANGPT